MITIGDMMPSVLTETVISTSTALIITAFNHTRALPLEETDAVPLGYSSTIVGISAPLDRTDGLTAMNVYVEDKLTNISHDLKSGPYTFATKRDFQRSFSFNVQEQSDFRNR
jgi:hypothetical protein